MITVYSESKVDPDKIQEYLSLAKLLLIASREEKGCIEYEFVKVINSTNEFAFMEKWETLEDLENHKKTEHFTSLIPRMNKMRKVLVTNVHENVL